MDKADASTLKTDAGRHLPELVEFGEEMQVTAAIDEQWAGMCPAPKNCLDQPAWERQGRTTEVDA